MLTSTFLRWMESLYGFFVKIGSNLQSIFLLYMRLTWGHQLFLAGLYKLQTHAYEVGILEAVGGACLFIGFASRIITIPIIIIMTAALSTVHAEALSNLQFVTTPFHLVVQQPYPFLITSLMVFLFGPGRVSLDAWLKRWINKQPRY